jgi:hypothetical protein
MHISNGCYMTSRNCMFIHGEQIDTPMYLHLRRPFTSHVTKSKLSLYSQGIRHDTCQQTHTHAQSRGLACTYILIAPTSLHIQNQTLPLIWFVVNYIWDSCSSDFYSAYICLLSMFRYSVSVLVMWSVQWIYLSKVLAKYCMLFIYGILRPVSYSSSSGTLSLLVK